MLRPFPSSKRAAATTPAEPVGACVARFPTGGQPSPISRRVGFRIERFGACSAFTQVAAGMVAKPPLAYRYMPGKCYFRRMSLPPSSAPTGTRLERQLPGGIRTR